MANERVSGATVARLPNYLRCLIDLAANGAASVSSERLAELSDVNSATVRRDLATLGITGTRGVGYDVKYLVFQINAALGLNQAWPILVVGVGNLGRALANYGGLESRGFPIRALLDIDAALVGDVVAGVAIEHLDDLDAVVEREDVAMAVIATPAAVAQEVAEKLTAAGIVSILNFTATPISLPDEIEVRRVDLATELQILSFYQQRRTAARGGTGVPLTSAPALSAPS